MLLLRRASALRAVGLLLVLSGFPVGVGLGDAGLHGHRRGVGPAQILDVPARIVDLLDLERVDDEAQLLHLRP